MTNDKERTLAEQAFFDACVRELDTLISEGYTPDQAMAMMRERLENVYKDAEVKERRDALRIVGQPNK